MGEISFNYNVDTEPIQETTFKFWFSESIEYSFAYQRYIAFSDASIFNSPVAITKVATGLSQLYGLFADRTIGCSMYVNLVKSFQQSQSYMERNDVLSGAQKDDSITNVNKDTILNEDTFIMHQSEILSSRKNTNIGSSYISLKYYWSLKNNLFDVYESLMSGRDNDNRLNIFQNINLSPFRIAMNILKQYSGSCDTLKMNQLSAIMTEKKDIIHGNIIKQIFVNLPDLVVDVNPIINGCTPDKILDIAHDFIAGHQFGKVGSRFDDIRPGFQSNKRGTSFTDMFTARTDKEATISPVNILGVTSGAKYIFSTQQYAAHFYEKPLYYFDLDTFVVSERKCCITLDGVNAEKHIKEVWQNNALHPCFKHGKSICIENDISLSDGDKKLITDSMIYTVKNDKQADSDRYQNFVVNSKEILYPTDKLATVDKTLNNVNHYVQTFIDKHHVAIDLFTTTQVGKFGQAAIMYPQQDIFTKDKMSVEIYQKQTYACKTDKSFLVNNSEIFTYKDRCRLNMEALDDLFIQHSKRDMLPQGNGTSAYRASYEMSLMHQYVVDKTEYYISIFKHGQSLIKELITINNISDFDTVIRNNIPSDYSNVLNDSFAGIIIPLSKTRHQAYVDSINLMVQKVSKNGYIHQGITASVIPRSTYVNSVELFCDKKEFNLYVEYKNIQITRSKIRTFIGKNEFLKKTSISTAIKGSIWVDKKLYSIWSDKQLNVYRKAYEVFFDSGISITEGSRDIYINESLFVDKKEQMCYYDYGTTWLDKSLINTKIQSQLSLEKKDREGYMLDCISPFIIKDLEGFYDYVAFSANIIQESGLFRQIHDVHKKAYDTGIEPEDFGNWAWVYETPDPFGNAFGIDELLLPENDTKYEYFEDIIFDKENMRPRNPVKEINENTFIAKYPIRHPLPKYKDIGIDYDKGAIKLDQFYGIETSVMHAVFLKFYRIWQAKIFEFGTMTMVQSVKTMLEYIYAWILEYFPLEQIEQAIRVFKLIRWYGETSIIQNSQYIVSYEYDTLESKLNTGACLIPNDLDTQDTMYIDATMGVIRNNHVYINNGPAYVTFEVNNRKNSTFTFSLSNTVGSVNIYINDVLVDIISKSALNLTYELPYTGDVNIVKIEKPASHNLNGTFYIGNIKVPNCTFKELSIEFDPNLKAGNKPLNEIARKMISYANLYEDRDAAYEIIRKGNLGVGEIYKNLTEYWELHHQGKTKGKRLTIKEI